MTTYVCMTIGGGVGARWRMARGPARDTPLPRAAHSLAVVASKKIFVFFIVHKIQVLTLSTMNVTAAMM